MLIFKNKGILIPVFVAVSVIGTAFIVEAVKWSVEDLTTFEPNGYFVLGLGLFISSAWIYFVRHDYVKNKWGQKILVPMENEFYFLSMKTWSIILSIAGFCVIIYGGCKAWL